MAAARTLIGVSWSVQRADHGEQPYWMTVTLAAMLGQIGLPGGGFGFGYGAMHGIGGARQPVTPASLPKGANTVESWIPVARLADMLLNPDGEYSFNGEARTYPDIRLVYWCGGNPFHKQQDLNRLLRGWARPETIIIHEPWWTPAAKRADIVLPCTTTLERNDIAASMFDRFLLANHKAIEPVGQARSEYEIYSDLAGRLGFHEAFTEGRTEMDWLRHLYDVFRQRASSVGIEMPSFDGFWRTGISSCRHPRRRRSRSPASAKTPRASRSRPRRARSRSTPRRSPISAMTTVPATRSGSSRPNGSAAPGRRGIRCTWSPTSRGRGCTASSIAARSAGRPRSPGARRCASARTMRRREGSPTAMWCGCSTTAASAWPARC